MAEGFDGEANYFGLTTDLEHRHISELHELAAAAGVPKFRTLRRDELAAAINAAITAEVRTEPEAEVEPEVEVEVGGTKGEGLAYAIIRVARGSRWTPGPKPEQVSVEKIVSSEGEAERETERLKSGAQTEQSGATYFWRAAVLE